MKQGQLQVLRSRFRRPEPYLTRTSSSTRRLYSSADDSDNNEYSNRNNYRDQVFSALSSDGGIKVTACTIRNLLNDMMLQHTLSETSTDALGRSVICALLTSNGMQAEQILQLTVNTNGPIRGIVAIASGDGQVRGYVGTPGLTQMPLPQAIGKGSLQIVKNHPSWPRPYNGITALEYGDIDRDMGIYLAESEQRSCALAAATQVTGVLCKAAGGYLIEQLPGVDAATIAKVEENLAKLVEMDGGSNLPANLLLNGVTPYEIAKIVLDGVGMEPLQQITPKLQCDCSEDRLFRSIRLLPLEDVEDILEKQEAVEARCQFCGTTYRMEAEDVRERLAKATGDPSRDDEV